MKQVMQIRLKKLQTIKTPKIWNSRTKVAKYKNKLPIITSIYMMYNRSWRHQQKMYQRRKSNFGCRATENHLFWRCNCLIWMTKNKLISLLTRLFRRLLLLRIPEVVIPWYANTWRDWPMFTLDQIVIYVEN